MRTISLTFLLLLPLLLNSQSEPFMLLNTPIISEPMLMTDPVPQIMLMKPFIMTSSSPCSVNEVPNNQHVCIKPSYIQGCELYQTPTTCYTCAKGYKLNTIKACDYNSLSTVSATHIKGCIQQKSDVCQICAEGFYKSQNKCLIGTQNCAKYNHDGSCLECEPEYSLIVSQCKHNNLLGCKVENKDHTCSLCYSPFQLVDQLCKIPDCRSLNDYGCVSCECGYYLTAERTCSQIQPGCLRYQNGICKDCLSHYKLKGGVCEIQGCLEYDAHYCKKCGDKYDLIQGECKFKNCFDWLNDQCIACEKGFSLKNGICNQSTQTACS